MAERKWLFSPQTESLHIIYESNKIFSLADIRNRRQVKHGRHILARKIHHRREVSEDHAAHLVANAVTDTIRRGLPILIDDRTRLRVVYLAPSQAKAVEIMQIGRSNSSTDGKKIIKDPHFTGAFFEGETGRIEFMLGVEGRRFAEKDGQRSDIAYHIRSDGKNRPSAFSIVSPESVILARVDSNGSLTCAWEYKEWAWYVKR